MPTFSQSAGHFQTLLAKSPPLPVLRGATRSWFSGSHVIQRHQCLALWLRFEDIWRVSRLAPTCVSHVAGFSRPKIPQRLWYAFKSSSPLAYRPCGPTKASHSPSDLVGRLIRLSYTALVTGCPMPERVRQFSLAPLTRFRALSSLRRVTGSTIACRPAAGFAPTYWRYPLVRWQAHPGICSRRPCPCRPICPD